MDNVFIISKEKNIKDFFNNPYEINYRKTNYKVIYENKMNYSNNLKSKLKQSLKYFFSLISKTKGDPSYEIIRICKENKS